MPLDTLYTVSLLYEILSFNKSSAVAEMGDRGHNSVGCHSPRRNISTNYYFVVEMLTITVRSDDARYLLKIQLAA